MHSKLLLVITAIFFTTGLLAQSSLEEKLEEIEGKVNEITITTDGKTHSFSGEEAEKLFKRIKRNHFAHDFVWVDAEDNGKTKKKIIIMDDDGDVEYEFKEGDAKVKIFKGDKFDKLENVEVGKKIKVELKDGNKKVTVTTTENGETKTETYEGEEADEYLEELEEENDFDIEMDFDDENDSDVKKIIIEKKKTEKKD